MGLMTWSACLVRSRASLGSPRAPIPSRLSFPTQRTRACTYSDFLHDPSLPADCGIEWLADFLTEEGGGSELEPVIGLSAVISPSAIRTSEVLKGLEH